MYPEAVQPSIFKVILLCYFHSNVIQMLGFPIISSEIASCFNGEIIEASPGLENFKRFPHKKQNISYLMPISYTQ